MKSINLFIILFLLLCFTKLYGQIPVAGSIDFYGRGTPDDTIKKCLTFFEKDSIVFIDDDLKYTGVKSTIEKCLMKIPKVKQAEITFVCCTQPDNYWMIYVGTDTSKQKSASTQYLADIRLPKEIRSSYNKVNDLLYDAVVNNETTEDNSNGHTLMQYEPLKKIQLSYIAYADSNIRLLRSILSGSKYPEEREAAALVISYYHNKKEIVNDLLNAMSDPDVAVRNNAIRAIGVIADYSITRKDLAININPDPFIKLLNSISWTDRNKSSMVLLSLTNDRNADVLEKIKKDAIESITDMAAWKNFGHSLPGYILLGRIIGWQEQVIMSGINNERTAQLQEMKSYLK